MNDKVLINVKGYINRFIDKSIRNNINLYNIFYINDDEINALIDFKNYKLIKKINYYSKIKLIKYEGLNGIKYHLKLYLYSYLLLLFSIILMDIITGYIVRIDIIHENNNIRSLIKKELDNHGISKYHLAYSFKTLEKIKEEILNDNPTNLEWMSITKNGMRYIIRVEERIINNNKESEGFRNIIAAKDAYITKIVSTKGDVLVKSGDYVKKDSTLISGEIKLYEEIKGNTKATGDVYGDVWYNINIKIPVEETIHETTGKSRYNFNINNKIFLKNKYPYFTQDNIRELKILGVKIKIYKENEYKLVKKKYNSKQLETIALNRVNVEFNKKLGNNGKIIRKIILKKALNNSTIDYRIFVVVNENIGKYLYYKVGEENDTQISN